ncbi:MAG TPA: hypothetical protein VFA09_14455 [Ktedonobacteraceae bacterium]|nr:hypothetical protein [Ktedonobacteraceae bacterium]
MPPRPFPPPRGITGYEEAGNAGLFVLARRDAMLAHIADQNMAATTPKNQRGAQSGRPTPTITTSNAIKGCHPANGPG